MLTSALVVLTLIGFATSEPPPVRISQEYTSGHSSYPGIQGISYPGGSQPTAAYRGPGKPGSAYAGFRAGLLQGMSGGGILNNLFGWAGSGQQKPYAHIKNNDGYSSYTQPKSPGPFALGSSYSYDSAKGGMGGLSFGLRSPQKFGGSRPFAFGAPKPMPTVHDDNPWIPVKSAPVDVVLNKPAEEYGHASTHSRMSITPSMSYGYSYKLIPTFAYGPTLSGGQSRYGR